MDHFFIAGTDTGVGKTILSLLLMHYFFEKKYFPFYLKPFQTGCKDPCDTDSDARFIYSNVRQLRGKDPSESVVFCFNNPKAPWFAGRDMGRAVSPDPVIRIVKEKKALFTSVIVEGAGGVLVPLTENLLLIDIVKDLELKVVLAARGSLGTINHTLLSIEAIRKRGLEVTGVVFIEAGNCKTPEDLLQENMEAVEKFSGIAVPGVIGQIRDFSNPGRDYIPVLDTLFK
jgi:dethiobiotin synthetase